MNKIAYLAWLGAAAFLAYPLAVAVHPAAASLLDMVFGTQFASVEGRGRFSILLPIATLLIYAAFPSRLRLLGTVGWRSSVKTAVLWSLGSILLWLPMLYFVGRLGLVDYSFLATAAAVQVILFLVSVFFRGGGAHYLTALGAGVAILALSSERLSRPRATTASDWSGIAEAAFAGPYITVLLFLAAAVASFLALRRRIVPQHGGSPWRRSALNLVWVTATHVLWIVALFLVGRAEDLPRWLPLVTGVTMTAIAVVLPLGYHNRKGMLGFGEVVYNPSRTSDANVWPSLVKGTGSGVRRAWVISYTGVSNEPRVLRQCEALIEAGWEVVVCGFDGHSKRPDKWTFVRLPSTEPFRNSFHTALRSAKALSHLLMTQGRSIGPFKHLAHVAHGTNPLWLHIRKTLVSFAKDHPELKADLVIAHDYYTCDVAYAIATHYGAKFSVDVHEYAREQYSNDPQ